MREDRDTRKVTVSMISNTQMAPQDDLTVKGEFVQDGMEDAFTEITEYGYNMTDNSLETEGLEALVRNMIPIFNSPILTLLAVPVSELMSEEDLRRKESLKKKIWANIADVNDNIFNEGGQIDEYAFKIQGTTITTNIDDNDIPIINENERRKHEKTVQNNQMSSTINKKNKSTGEQDSVQHKEALKEQTHRDATHEEKKPEDYRSVFFEESISGITRRSVMAEQEGESEKTESKINQWNDYSQREQPTYGGMNEIRKHSFTNDENGGEEKGTKSGDIEEAEHNIYNEAVKTELDEVT